MVDKNPKLRLLAVVPALAILLGPGAVQAENTRVTIQDDRLNVNRTFQVGCSDNTTYQTGSVNINRTIQLGECNDNTTHQVGKVNINRTLQAGGTNTNETSQLGTRNHNWTHQGPGLGSTAAKRPGFKRRKPGRRVFERERDDR